MKKAGDYCPFCKGRMIGQSGSRTCENINCGTYEVNEDNYNIKRSERHDLPKVEKTKKVKKDEM